MTASTDNALRDRPTGELLRDLSDHTTTLVKQEMELAKAELQEKGKQAGAGRRHVRRRRPVRPGRLRGADRMPDRGPGQGDGDLVGRAGCRSCYGVIAAVLAMTGKQKVKQAAPPVPEQARESVKEDMEWAKTQARSGRT